MDKPKNAPIFIPEILYAECTKVYDGDTIHVEGAIKPTHEPDCSLQCACYFKHRFRWTVRLRGIDTPEIHGPDHERACEVRDALSSLILYEPLILSDVKYDKYGRILANVALKDGDTIVDCSKWLIDQGYGKAYYGGKKE